MAAAKPKKIPWRWKLLLFLLVVGAGGAATYALVSPEQARAFVIWAHARFGYAPGRDVERYARWWVAGLGGLVFWSLLAVLAALVRFRRRRLPPPPPPPKNEYELQLEALQAEETTARIRAAQYLGEVGGAEAIDPLLQMLTTSTGAARRAAAEALYKIGRAVTAEVSQQRHQYR
ncbi:MAG TPA: hypothetical protein EYP85_17085 [Armatimonadetes bacterium]|nr:hypothetical protein [Armatimonadota bacterium]